MTRDMGHKLGGEHSLKISAPQLLWFGIDSALNIYPQTISHSLNHKAVYRTAPATPGLLIIYGISNHSHMTQFQIEGGGLVQGVTKLITTFSAFVT